MPSIRRWRMRSVLLALLFVPALLPACSQTIEATRVGVRITLSEPADQPPVGTAFRISKKAAFLFWGIIPVSRPSVEDVLAGQLIDGAGIADLRIKVRSRFTDILVSILTLGIVVPRSVTFEGVVVPHTQ